MSALLLDAALKGALVLAAAAGAARLLHRAPASARHLAWGAGLAALLALPILALALPAWRVSVLPSPGSPSSVSADVGDAAADEVRTAIAAVGTLGDAKAAPDGRDAPRPLPVAALALAVWGMGAAAGFARLGASVLRVRTDARRAREIVGGAAADARDRIARRLGIRRPVRLLEGAPDAMPLTWGVLRPRILLPAGTERWPAARLEAVLTHEMAHVRRCDAGWQLAAEAACALHWFDPLAWMAARRLRLEAEQACDDHVLMAGSRGCDYAGHLLDVARTLRPPRAAALGAVAMARPTQLRTRVQAVLAERRRGPVARRAAAPALAMAAALVASLAAMTPARTLAGPLVTPGECATTGRGRSSYDVVDRHGAWTVRWSNLAGCGGEARIVGVRFAAGLDGVDDVARDGVLRLELRDGRHATAVELRPSAGGIARTMRVDGAPRAWDAAADAWLAAAVAELMRHTTYAAEQPGGVSASWPIGPDGPASPASPADPRGPASPADPGG